MPRQTRGVTHVTRRRAAAARLPFWMIPAPRAHAHGSNKFRPSGCGTRQVRPDFFPGDDIGGVLIEALNPGIQLSPLRVGRRERVGLQALPHFVPAFSAAVRLVICSRSALIGYNPSAVRWSVQARTGERRLLKNVHS